MGCYGYDIIRITQTFDKKHNFSYILTIDAYSNISKRYGIEKVTTEEVLDNLNIFQSRSGKIENFGLWDLERISADAGTQFTKTKFEQECQNCGVQLTLAAPEHQEMNR